MRTYYLPDPVFLLAVIHHGVCPAVQTANGGDGLLLLGSDKAVATTHLVIMCT